MDFLERERAVHEKADSNVQNLSGLRKALSGRLDALYNECDKGGGGSDIGRRKQEAISEFLRELMDRKEFFHSVFETEQGSVYFVSEDGSSWRFKKKRESYKDQPIMGKVVFVSEAEKNELLRIVRSPLSQENIIGHCFEKTGISEGVFPVEIGAISCRLNLS